MDSKVLAKVKEYGNKELLRFFFSKQADPALIVIEKALDLGLVTAPQAEELKALVVQLS